MHSFVKPRHRYRLPALLCALALSACVGQRASYPSYAIAPVRDITVIPLTAEYLAEHPDLEVKVVPVANPSADRTQTGPYRYLIRPGDLLDISVPSLVSLNMSGGASILGERERGYVVYDDGTIYVPYAGTIAVGGLSQQQAQQQVVQALSRYLKRPEITVSVREFRSQRVLVSGQVQRPGYLPITDVPLTVIGALSTAGALGKLRGPRDPRPIGASGQAQYPPEHPDLSRVTLRRDGGDLVLDVERMLANGSVDQDLVLKDGDVLIVPAARRSNIVVMGEIVRPALLEIASNDTDLAEVLMATGGINQLTANASRVYVIRGEFDKPTIYQLNARSPDSMLLAQRFEVMPRDVVYVTEAGVTRWNRMLQAILPSLQGLLSTAVIANTVDDVQDR